jgi:transcription antitermination factor NusG
VPLFPGYVCCRIDVRNLLAILAIPGVTHILGTGDTPDALDDVEVASLQTAIRSPFSIQPFPFIRYGQRVRIQSGALAGVEGILMRSSQTVRVVLSISVIQRSVLLEIDRDTVTLSKCSETAPFELVKGD